MPRLSSSVPPSRSASVNCAVATDELVARGLTYIPEPTYEVALVVASPVAYQSAPLWYSRSPVDSDKMPSEIGSHVPSSLGLARLFSCLRNTPPLAPPANR